MECLLACDISQEQGITRIWGAFGSNPLSSNYEVKATFSVVNNPSMVAPFFPQAAPELLRRSNGYDSRIVLGATPTRL